MGRLPNGERKYSIKEMWDVHHNICNRLMMGQQEVDIARELGVTPAMVSYTRNSPIVRHELNGLREEANERAVDIAVEIRNTAPRALQVISQIMDDPNCKEGVRLNAARDILDRAGYQPVQKTANFTMHATAEDIREIKRRALERAEMSSNVVTVDESVDGTMEESELQENAST